MSARHALQHSARPHVVANRPSHRAVKAPLVPLLAHTAFGAGTATDPHGNRRLFWHAYQAWLSTASTEDVDQLEQALVQHTPHVRSIHLAISDALRATSTVPTVPMSLVVALDNAGWLLDPPMSLPMPLLKRSLSMAA